MSTRPEDSVPEAQDDTDSFVDEVTACIAEYDKAALFREAVAAAADVALVHGPPTD
jgi:hypothetical protein